MSQFIITDLDFCQTELPNQAPVTGSGTLNNVKWAGTFDFSFSHDRISSYSLGFVTAAAIAIGPIIIPLNNRPSFK